MLIPHPLHGFCFFAERVATFERIIEEAPATFNPDQLRMFLRLLVNVNPYDFLEEAAAHFSTDENEQRSDDGVVLAALSTKADEKLTGFALRIVLADHVSIPLENGPDLLTEAEEVFAPKKSKVVKTRSTPAKKPKSVAVNPQRRKASQSRKLPSVKTSGSGSPGPLLAPQKRQVEPGWVSPCTLIRLISGPTLAGCAVGVKFLLRHLSLRSENGVCRY